MEAKMMRRDETQKKLIAWHSPVGEAYLSLLPEIGIGTLIRLSLPNKLMFT